MSGHESNEFTRTYDGDPRSRVLDETHHFAIVVDISPLVEGHLLIVPRKHYLNFGSAMVDYPDEAIGALERARDWVRETYGTVALFEHGTTPDRAGGACIDHAHVHVLPVAAEALVDVMRGDDLELETLGDIASWMDIADTSRSYFLCSDGESLLVAFPVRPVRRQYLRSAAAQVLGMSDPDWDWALFIRKDLLRETVRRYKVASKEPREAHSHERGELGP